MFYANVSTTCNAKTNTNSDYQRILQAIYDTILDHFKVLRAEIRQTVCTQSTWRLPLCLYPH